MTAIFQLLELRGQKRQRSETGFSRFVTVLLILGAVLLFAIVLLSLHFADKSRKNVSDALEADRLNIRTMTMFRLVQDAETSQRGFLLTGEDKYLDPFKRAEVMIRLQFFSVIDDLVASGISSVTVSRLKQLIDDKLSEMKSTIELRKSGRATDALGVVQTDAGKRAMDEIRQIMARIDATARDIASEREEALYQALRLLLVAISVGAVLLVLLVGGAVYLIVAHARQLAAARADLALQNENLEIRIRQRTQYLERANRELQSYSYIVGHDLRAPLVNIMGFTSELERAAAVFAGYIEKPISERDGFAENAAREAITVDIPEALRFIRSSMKRMDDLINEILKLARAGSRQLHAELVDLSELLQETIADLQHRLDESGASVVISTTMPSVISDRLALQQIFGNLLDNAVKYADPARPASIRLSGDIIGANAVIRVVDNGRGISERDSERIFELFRRSGPQDRPGEGIGLAHVRALVRRLGGDVAVESVLGTGTTFVVTIAADFRPLESREEQ